MLSLAMFPQRRKIANPLHWPGAVKILASPASFGIGVGLGYLKGSTAR